MRKFEIGYKVKLKKKVYNKLAQGETVRLGFIITTPYMLDENTNDGGEYEILAVDNFDRTLLVRSSDGHYWWMSQKAFDKNTLKAGPLNGAQ